MRNRARTIAVLLILLSWGMTGCVFPSAEHTPLPSPTPPPSPTPLPSPSPTPVPTPTSVPTPTPDPLDAYFAAEGEEIIRQDFDAWDAWYYQSHDLCVDICKIVDAEARQTYYVADLRVRGDVLWSTGYPNADKPGRGKNKLPYKLARQYQAVYAQNGDFLTEEKETKGILIKNGTLLYEGTRQDTLALLPDGEMRIYSPGEITGEELLSMGVQNTFSFGPTLVRDGQINPDIRKHRVSKLKNPRSALGMIEPGHYIAIVVEGRDNKRSVGMTCEELANLFISYGCTVAYNLDGGASSSMVFMGNSLITHETYYFGQRSVPDILMLGTSAQVPGVNDPTQYTGVGHNCPVTPSPTLPATATPSADITASPPPEMTPAPDSTPPLPTETVPPPAPSQPETPPSSGPSPAAA